MNKKPLGGKSYGSIPHLMNSKLGIGDHHIHEGQHKILTLKKRDKNDTIFVTEKYDGSNVSIANIQGSIYAITRSGYEARTSPHKQHLAFARWVDLNRHHLKLFIPKGFRLCCEWLIKKHTLEYEYLINTQECNIVAFDLICNKNNNRLSYLDFYCMDTWLIPKARLLHVGNSICPKDLLPKLNIAHDHKVQTVPDNNPEGLVYRAERNGKVDFLAKWVRTDFIAGLYL